MNSFVTAQEMREIEARAIAAGSVTGLMLMERAGHGVVEAIFEHWPQLEKTKDPKSAIVLCGPGNNGGDGFVVARLLAEKGWQVEVFFYGETDRLPADAKTNHDRWQNLAQGQIALMTFPNATEAEADAILDRVCTAEGTRLVIDALFGIGLTRPLTGLSPLIQKTALFKDMPGVGVVSIDMPSGLAEDDEIAQDGTHVFKPDLTVTFHRKKRAHQKCGARCGELVVKDIGL